MNRIVLVFVAALFLFACNNSNQTKDSDGEVTSTGDVKVEENKSVDQVLYGTESAYMKYKMTIEGAVATTDRYFKNYGKEDDSRTEIEVQGQTMKSRSLLIGEYSYYYMEGSPAGYKSKRKNTEEGRIDFFAVSEKEVLKNGGKKVGEETIAGKECAIYEMPDEENEKLIIKIWVWKSIPFKLEESGKVIFETVEFKETSDFPDGTFDIPENINFTDQSIDNEIDNSESESESDSGSDSDFDEEGAKG